jgi:4-hydroxy-4-methyl-2-oxoglutarate aldolase
MPKPRPRRTPTRAIPAPELCDRYARLYTAAITDVLDKRGCFHQTLPRDIVGLTPQMRIAGLAFPASGRVTRNSDLTRALRAFLSMLSAVPQDAVLIVQSNDEGAAAHFGELSAVALRARGARGAVIDGATRDAAYLLHDGFPVFCRYRTPMDSGPRWLAVEWGQPVTIGGVRVEPGDMVVGDLDGVVAVPKALAIPVLLDCESLMHVENSVRDAVRTGLTPLAAYEKFGYL